MAYSKKISGEGLKILAETQTLNPGDFVWVEAADLGHAKALQQTLYSTIKLLKSEGRDPHVSLKTLFKEGKVWLRLMKKSSTGGTLYIQKSTGEVTKLDLSGDTRRRLLLMITDGLTEEEIRKNFPPLNNEDDMALKQGLYNRDGIEK